MPQTYRVLLHANSGTDPKTGSAYTALWPEHKPLADVLELKAITPEHIWHGTYQGTPTSPQGATFKRAWWTHTRFDAASPARRNRSIGRWISIDTAESDKNSAAYSAAVVGELTPEYTLDIPYVWRERLLFPDLLAHVAGMVEKWDRDGKLRGVIIEAKSTGTSLFHTMAQSLDDDTARKLIAFTPTTDKDTRATQASTWCFNGSVWLPRPSQAAPWLLDFEDELFTIPASEYRDQADAFAQLLIYVENLLADGLRARSKPQ